MGAFSPLSTEICVELASNKTLRCARCVREPFNFKEHSEQSSDSGDKNNLLLGSNPELLGYVFPLILYCLLQLQEFD